MTKSKKPPKTLHSGCYWQEFHRRRAEREARTAQRRSRGAAGSHNRYYEPDTLQSPPLIVTFIPNREAPLYTHVQNNRSLITSYDPLSIQPTPPATHARETDPPLPARCEPPPPYRSSRRSVAIQRAEERLRTRPTDDEILLERLTKRHTEQTKTQSSSSETTKTKSSSSQQTSRTKN
ncbi:hypothetical protein B0H13DRAFT_2356490 [Mycena leptocephala]|nr:hypothetical protein B0H13DRAFT_2356490 [Mycena leptocephala]